jgi:serine/threonine-protein kinase RsbW
MGDRLVLRLKSAVEELETLNAAFGEFAERHGLSASVIFAVSLALEEVFVNIVTHGYCERKDGIVAVEVRIDSAEVVLIIEDYAPAYNQLEAPRPDVTVPLEERRPGGLGMHLTRKLMDKLDYSRFEGKNRLVLTKHLS